MRTEIDDNMAGIVSGGNVTFTPSSPGSQSGVIGLNGREHYTYTDEEAVIEFITEHCNDKKFKTVDQQDQYLLNGLLKAGLIVGKRKHTASK